MTQLVRKVFTGSSFVMLLITLTFSASSLGQYKQIPSPDEYGEFLLAEWDANKRTLLVFADPMCRYCVKDLQRGEFKEKYNVFLFWAPVLGDASSQIVENYFACGEVNGPTIIDAFLSYRAPDCIGSFDATNFQKNHKMVEAYSPQIVPQYWFGGRLTHISQL